MRGIAKALLSDDRAALDRAVNREVLRAAVARQMFCDQTGKLLDVSDAVLVTVTHKSGRGARLLSGAAFDEIKEHLTNRSVVLGAELEIIDGRDS
ncbi:hypothetical protein [Micromonospora sp. NPDC048839]|uniref:hypothetical protein n=1 Tax=Micromonospora sp. NPDC048839 TaxID=3155641 RepID=UPI0033F030CA